MALQKSLIKIEGTLDDLIFYKMQDQYYIRSKGGISAHRIKTEPNFTRTRENNKEFASASSAARVLRNSFMPIIRKAGDTFMFRRLVSILQEIKTYDIINDRGERTVENGLMTDMGKRKLNGFSFNSQSILSQIFNGKFEINPINGRITIRQIISNKHLKFPEGSTHAGFQTMWAMIDFKSKKSTSGLSNELILPLNQSLRDIELVPEIPTGNGNYFQVLKICFYQERNGEQYILKNAEHSPVEIVYID